MERIFHCANLFGLLSFFLLVAWQVGAQTQSDVQLLQSHSTTEPLTVVNASQIQLPKNDSITDQALIRERINKIMLETIKAGETVIMVAGQQKVFAITFSPPSSETLEEIKSYGDLAVPILAKYLRQESGFEKYHAMRFLGAIGRESVVAQLSQVALHDPSAGYREYALAFLTQAPWKLAAPILREAASHDASISVRQRAQELLDGYAPR